MKIFNLQKLIIISVVLLFLVVGLFIWILKDISFVPMPAGWSIGIYTGQSPFDLVAPENVDNPVLTGKDVSDVTAEYVADPFMVKENSIWYMFFEVAAAKSRLHPETSTGAKSASTQSIRWGRIGLATSDDGFNWTYRRIVLDELYPRDDPRGSVHHSYPLIIKHYNRYFMITEAYMQNQIRFYEARNFPDDWERVYTITKCTGDTSTLVTPGQCIETGNPVIGDLDPSIFRYQGKWWMFSGQGDDCYLYYSDHLLSGWTEHPLSPVVPNDDSQARPGGRAFVFDGDRVIRLAQKGDDRYGQRVRAFEVTTLTEDDYQDYEITEGAPFCTNGGVFCESGGGLYCDEAYCEESEDAWNLCCMHNLDLWWTGEYWLMVTDGRGCRDSWSIGIFVGTPGPLSAGGKDPFEERDMEIREDVTDESEIRTDIPQDVEIR